MELHTITLHSPGTPDHGRPMTPMDDNPGHPDHGLLVYLSREAAIEAARYQTKLCDLHGPTLFWDATPLSSVDPKWLDRRETSPSL